MNEVGFLLFTGRTQKGEEEDEQENTVRGSSPDNGAGIGGGDGSASGAGYGRYPDFSPRQSHSRVSRLLSA
jgi:hypothetical protein